MSELLDAALNYAAQGWYVFPIVPNRKKPAMIEDYYVHSSIDPLQIAAWWGDCPQANIGLDCHKSGLAVIDADTKEGHGENHDATKTLQGLMVLTGGKRAWDTLQARTPSGGTHFIFKRYGNDQELYLKTNSNTFGGSGVDTRGRGGYIVLPPSKVPEGVYRFANQVPPKDIPRKLLSKPGVYRDEDGKTALERKLEQGELIGKGGRDNFLISLLGKFKDQGLEFEELRALVEAAYKLRCDPADDPMTSLDFDRLAKSAMRWEATKDVPGEAAKKAPTESTGIYNKADESFAIPASDFLVNYEDDTEWIVDKILQRRSVNMLMGPPKGGKSTLSRHLAVGVAYGFPFLGKWATKSSPVLYYTLQENKAQLLGWLKSTLTSLKLSFEGVPIDFVFRLNVSGRKALDGLRARLEEKPYGLVVIDMLNRFGGFESLDDYTEVDHVTSMLNEIAQDTNTCILWLHHEGKSYDGSPSFAGSIGSQAIRGSVYTTLRAWKDKGRRYIASEQRDGEDIEPTVVTLNKKTNDMRASTSRLGAALADRSTLEGKVESLLQENPGVSAAEARQKLGGRHQEISSLLEKARVKLAESNFQPTDRKPLPTHEDQPSEPEESGRADSNPQGQTR